MIINNREFVDYGQTARFVRHSDYNQCDISQCSALAMHKAIIGIVELKSLEEAKKLTGNQFIPSIAVETYYIIYHLFCCCMLLDDEYDIIIRKKDDTILYGRSPADFVPPVSWEDWDNRRMLEYDLATNIGHGDIRKYCNKLRTRGTRNRPSYIEHLYNSFVKPTAMCLFEKAEYLRDKAIYRPSHVASLDGNKDIQTSLNTREYVNQLPASSILFELVCKIQVEIARTGIDKEKNEDRSLETDESIAFMGSNVDCETEYANQLGYNWNILQQLGGDRDEASVPSFIAQLMEQCTPDVLINNFNSYWKPLLDSVSNVIYGCGWKEKKAST